MVFRTRKTRGRHVPTDASRPPDALLCAPHPWGDSHLARRNFSMRKRYPVLAIAVLVLVVAGCGGGGGGSSSSGGGNAATTVSSGAKKGGHLDVLSASDIDGLDPGYW